MSVSSLLFQPAPGLPKIEGRLRANRLGSGRPARKEPMPCPLRSVERPLDAPPPQKSDVIHGMSPDWLRAILLRDFAGQVCKCGKQNMLKKHNSGG